MTKRPHRQLATSLFFVVLAAGPGQAIAATASAELLLPVANSRDWLAQAPSEDADALTVDTSGLADTDMREPVTKAVHRDGAPVLALYLKMGGSLQDVSIWVKISDQTSASGDAAAEGYFFVLKAESVGSSAVEVAGSCGGCTERELVKAVTDALPELLGKLDEQRGRAPLQNGNANDPEGPRPDSTAGSDGAANSDRKRPPLGGMGKAGVALIVLGVPSLAAGIGLAVRPDRASGDPAQVQQSSTHSAGYALVGLGAASAIAGIALLATDRVRARKSSAAAPRRAALGLVPVHDGVYVSVGCQF